MPLIMLTLMTKTQPGPSTRSSLKIDSSCAVLAEWRMLGRTRVFWLRVLVKYFDVDLSHPIIRFDTDMINIINDIVINLLPALGLRQL